MNPLAILVLTLAASLPTPQAGLPETVREALVAAYTDAVDGDAEAIGRYGMVLLAHHLNQDADVVLGLAVDAAPDDRRWRYLYAYTAHQLGELEVAVQRYDEVLARFDDEPITRLNRAAALLELGRLDEAEAALNADGVRAANPAFVASLLGRSAYLRGDFATAIVELERALRLAPAATRLHHTLGLAYRRTGRVDLARSHFDSAGEGVVGALDPLLREVRALNRSVQSLIQRGLGLAEVGDLDGSIELLRSAVELMPDDATSLVTLAAMLKQAGRLDEAEQMLSRCIATNPDYTPAYFRLGVLRANAGRLEDALALYRQVVAINPVHTEARYQIGATLLTMDRPAAAEAMFRELATQHTDNLFIRNQRVIALLASGDCDALTLARESRARAPRRGDVLFLYLRALAACATDRRTIDAAVTTATRLVQTRPAADALETQGLVLAAAGRIDDARAAFQRALAAEPAGPFAPFLERRLASLAAGDGVGDPLPAGHPVRDIVGNEAKP
jgi:tetratricopeptide (TPR) repeat protein